MAMGMVLASLQQTASRSPGKESHYPQNRCPGLYPAQRVDAPMSDLQAHLGKAAI